MLGTSMSRHAGATSFSKRNFSPKRTISMARSSTRSSTARSPAVIAVRAAVDAMLHLAPTDTDYYSAWPKATTVKGVSTSGKVATIDLSANARSVTTTRKVVSPVRLTMNCPVSPAVS